MKKNLFLFRISRNTYERNFFLRTVKIFIDADSCPVLIRPIIEKAAARRRLETVFVADRPVPLSENGWVSFQKVKCGAGSADDWIFNAAAAGDLIITRDIPFAARLLEKNAVVINDRGFEFTSDNIKSKLSERDIMKTFYESGLAVQGLKSYGKKEAFDFANRFDAVLTRMEKVARDQT